LHGTGILRGVIDVGKNHRLNGSWLESLGRAVLIAVISTIMLSNAIAHIGGAFTIRCRTLANIMDR
jgi:hypothetical protein